MHTHTLMTGALLMCRQRVRERINDSHDPFGTRHSAAQEESSDKSDPGILVKELTRNGAGINQERIRK